jgi:hypothetical protein
MPPRRLSETLSALRAPHDERAEVSSRWSANAGNFIAVSTSDFDPLSTEKGSTLDAADGWTAEALWPSAIPDEWMEHLWSPAGATGGKWDALEGR